MKSQQVRSDWIHRIILSDNIPDLDIIFMYALIPIFLSAYPEILELEKVSYKSFDLMYRSKIKI